MDNDFPATITVVDQDSAEQRVTEPADHDDALYEQQLGAEDESS